MEGRRPTGLMYVNTDVDAPHKRAEYHRWYVDVHFPEVVAPAIFGDARMFRNAREPLPEGELPFLALYETSRPDVEQAALDFERHVQGLVADRRIHPGTVGGLFAIYQRLALHASHPRPHAHSLVAVHLDAAEGGEPALRDWGAAQAAPDSGVFALCQTAGFFERTRGAGFAAATRPDQPRFLLLLESDRGDPVDLAGRLDARLGLADAGGLAMTRGVACFYRSSGGS